MKMTTIHFMNVQNYQIIFNGEDTRGRQRREGLWAFEASLVYCSEFQARQDYIMRPVSKKKKKENRFLKKWKGNNVFCRSQGRNTA